MEAVTVDNLPNAKMAVAHYGCWAPQGDRNGRRIYRTRDSKFPDKKSGLLDFCEELFPDLYAAVFGKATDLARFILEPLDPDKYEQCREVFNNLPESQRLSTGRDDFLSLFALGINPHTQRYRDTNDVAGGESFLLTLGAYTGKFERSISLFLCMAASDQFSRWTLVCTTAWIESALHPGHVCHDKGRRP
jgi:hypothetical protein